jgi:hypothetical protein
VPVRDDVTAAPAGDVTAAAAGGGVSVRDDVTAAPAVDVTAAAGWANHGSRHSRKSVVSSVQVKLVMSGGGGPITSVSRGNWVLGRPSFFHVKAFSQIRYSVHGSEGRKN